MATDCFLSSLQFNPSAELKYQAFVIPLVPNRVKVLLNLYTIDQKSQGVYSYPSSQSCTCFKLDSSNNKIMLYQICVASHKLFAARKFSNWSTKENQNYQISACLTQAMGKS